MFSIFQITKFCENSEHLSFYMTKLFNPFLWVVNNLPSFKSINFFRGILFLWTKKFIFFFFTRFSTSFPLMNKSKELYRLFSELFKVSLNDGINIGTTISIPHIDQNLLFKVLDESLTNLKKNTQTVINLDNPVIVVGDIHGNIVDLLRLFTINGLPPYAQYLFLGDYVDKGQYSLECITLLLAMQNIFPEDIHLLRGNHETQLMSSTGLFHAQVREMYPSGEIWNEIMNIFNEIFDYLPIAAVIANKILCLHGGLSPDFNTLSTLKEYSLPIHDMNGMIGDIIWGDWYDGVSYFRENKRGKGYYFGHDAVVQFLEKSKLNLIIRGHQHTSEGFRWDCSCKVLTVTSTSNVLFSYSAAFVIVSDRVVTQTLPPIDSPRRDVRMTHSTPVSAIKPTAGKLLILSKVPTLGIPKPKAMKANKLMKHSLPHNSFSTI